MRFIDEVLSADDQGARSRTVVRSDAIAVDDEGRFPALALIEVMAQTIGIYAGRIERINGRAPGAGLLLGTRRMEFDRPCFFPGRRAPLQRCKELRERRGSLAVRLPRDGLPPGRRIEGGTGRPGAPQRLQSSGRLFRPPEIENPEPRIPCAEARSRNRIFTFTPFSNSCTMSPSSPAAATGAIRQRKAEAETGPRRVLITGATRGIGRAMALRIAREGYEVVITGRKPSPQADEVLQTLKDQGARAHALFFDVTDRAAAQTALAGFTAEHGPFWGVILNAGINRDGPLAGMSEEDWDLVLETDLGGFYNGSNP